MDDYTELTGIIQKVHNLQSSRMGARLNTLLRDAEDTLEIVKLELIPREVIR
jgi:hypothetical protein